MSPLKVFLAIILSVLAAVWVAMGLLCAETMHEIIALGKVPPDVTIPMVASFLGAMVFAVMATDTIKDGLRLRRVANKEAKSKS